MKDMYWLAEFRTDNHENKKKGTGQMNAERYRKRMIRQRIRRIMICFCLCLPVLSWMNIYAEGKDITVPITQTFDVQGNGSADQKCQYQIEAGNQQSIMPQEGNAFVMEGNQTSALHFSFTQTGLYEYTVRPVSNTDGYSYDSIVYTIMIIVSDHSNQGFDSQVVVKNQSGVKSEQLSFHHMYTDTNTPVVTSDRSHTALYTCIHISSVMVVLLCLKKRNIIKSFQNRHT